jgi:signal transduction histidine kinase
LSTSEEPRPITAAADVLALFDRFFHRFPQGVIGFGADGRVLFSNSQAQLLPGVELGELLSEETLAEFADRVLAAPDDTHTARLALPDGRVLRASGLGPRGVEPAVLILEDVTLQEQHDQVMREFVRNAAHQLRTPLTAIATAVEVLQAGAKEIPDERDRFLEHIEAQSERLIRIARGLLVLARAQSGEPLQLETVELRPLLDELAAEAQPRRGVELSVECEPSLTALGSRDLVHEALAALVDNALEFTETGAIRLTACKQNGRVAISVTDTGGGVLPEHRERIFEPFYRPAAEGRGFGLGLAIAAQAVRAMDGELTVDDADAGARFTIRLVSGAR